jgi:hypothetical protein
MEVLRGMFILGGVATAHVPASQAQPQVHPRIPHLHTLFTNMLVGLLDLDLIEMRTFISHWLSPEDLVWSSDLGHVTKGPNHSRTPNSSLKIISEVSYVLRLDYLSCVLTISSTILVGRRCWEGWALGSINCVILCVIGLRTEQLGLIPANLFCMVVSAINVHSWRRSRVS